MWSVKLGHTLRCISGLGHCDKPTAWRAISPPILCPITDMYLRLGWASATSLNSAAKRLPQLSIPSNVCAAPHCSVSMRGHQDNRLLSLENPKLKSPADENAYRPASLNAAWSMDARWYHLLLLQAWCAEILLYCRLSTIVTCQVCKDTPAA